MTSPELASRLTQLLSILRRRTSAGTLRWKKSGDEEYETSGNQTSYVIKTRDKDGQAPYLLLGYDSSGRKMLEIDSLDEQIGYVVSEEMSALYLTVHGLVDNKEAIEFLDTALADIADDEPPF